jgi:long-chain acyl-CoA synthetase
MSYTSGTTGDSKGVKFTHKMLMSVFMSDNNLGMETGDRIISYLPMPHSYEQLMLAIALVLRYKIGYYSGDVLKIVEDCQKLQPSFFPSVPRFYNKIYAAIKAKFDAQTGEAAAGIQFALKTKIDEMHKTGKVTHEVFDEKIFKQAAAIMGGKLKGMATGGAPIEQHVRDFLSVVFSCPFFEGYAMTETGAQLTGTAREDFSMGNCGGPKRQIVIRLKDLPEMNYRITDQPYPRGEICVRGPSIFPGYFKRPDLTEAAFDEEGWFMTGDVAEVHPNGAIKVIDRSKNIFKTSQGEYIAPEKVEGIMTLSSYVAMSFVFGYPTEDCIVAVVVVNEDTARAWAAKNEITAEPLSSLATNETFAQTVLDDMRRVAGEKKLSSLETPRAIHLTFEPFTIESGILTPTMKLKRPIAKEHFKTEIDKMY